MNARKFLRSNGFFAAWRHLWAALLLAGVFAGSAVAGETSFKHSYLMRGQILEAEAGTVTVCVGKQDGAQVGQVLDVVRHVRVSSAGKTPGPRFRREDVGTLKITSLFDDHYATAAVITGSPKVNDTVELKK